jgi:hypothetical protein
MTASSLHRLFDLAERTLARIDQDRRNARVIGEFTVSGLRSRLVDRVSTPRTTTDQSSHNEAGNSDSGEVRADSIEDVHPLMLLGAAELLAAIVDLAPDELHEWRAVEAAGRRRPAILAAIDERLSGDDA